MFLTYILALFLTFNVFANSTQQCDAKQIAESKLKHDPEIIIQSVKEIFKSFYQNPNAFDLPPYEVLKYGELKGYAAKFNEISKGKNSYVVDLDAARKSQYYIDCSTKNSNPLCTTPPSYLWGGMGWYERSNDNKNQLTLDLHGNHEVTKNYANHPGLDCSGLTYAVYSNSKLRVTKDLSKTPSFETADNTPARSYLNLDSNSCFTEVLPKKNAKNALKSGDIIVWKGHMMIINTVGKDPWGIEHIKNAKNCTIKSIKPESSTMTVFNAKGGFDKHTEDIINAYSINRYFKKSHVNVNKHRDLLTGIGMGICKEKFSEFFYFKPDSIFPLANSWCQAKFSDQVATLADIKVIRHIAFTDEENKPCECFSREQDYLTLKP